MPSIRSLLITWGLLCALTVVTMVAGQARAHAPLGWIGMTTVLVIAALKGRLILRQYLNLRVAPEWSAGFTAAVVVLCAAVLALFVIGGTA